MNPATIWRWITRGFRTPDGRTVKLEAAKIGSQWITSEQALQRFIEQINSDTKAKGTEDVLPSRGRSAQRRQLASERALKKLDAGI